MTERLGTDYFKESIRRIDTDAFPVLAGLDIEHAARIRDLLALEAQGLALVSDGFHSHDVFPTKSIDKKNREATGDAIPTPLLAIGVERRPLSGEDGFLTPDGEIQFYRKQVAGEVTGYTLESRIDGEPHDYIAFGRAALGAVRSRLRKLAESFSS